MKKSRPLFPKSEREIYKSRLFLGINDYEDAFMYRPCIFMQEHV